MVAAQGASPGAAKQTEIKSVAVCLVGEARTLHCPLVYRNILKTMIDPIRSDADVFVAIKVKSKHYGDPQCIPNATDYEGALHQLVVEKFKAVDVMFRPDEDDPMANPMNGLHPAFQAGRPCMNMVRQREGAAGKQYRYVIHLRGDLVYRFALPAFAEWPASLSTHRGPLLFVEHCSVGDHGQCNPRNMGQGKLGCVSDTWGLMTRGVADLYYQQEWAYDYHDALAQERTGYGCIKDHPFECLRGCVMFYNRVQVQQLSRRGTIARDQSWLVMDDVRVCDEISLELPDPESVVHISAAKGDESDIFDLDFFGLNDAFSDEIADRVADEEDKWVHLTDDPDKYLKNRKDGSMVGASRSLEECGAN